MGDCYTEPLRPQFDRRIRLEFHGATLTTDAGLLAYRELDDARGLTEAAALSSTNRAPGATRDTASRPCCARRSMGAWPATRTSTTPNSSPSGSGPTAGWSVP